MRKRWVYENNESNLAVQQSTSSHMKAAFIQIHPGYLEANMWLFCCSNNLIEDQKRLQKYQ